MHDDPGSKLLERYLARRQAELPALEAAANRKDYELLRRLGHNLHGSGSAYGLDPISRLGASLELAAERGEDEKVAAALRDLAVFLSRLTAQHS